MASVSLEASLAGAQFLERETVLNVLRTRGLVTSDDVAALSTDEVQALELRHPDRLDFEHYPYRPVRNGSETGAESSGFELEQPVVYVFC